MIRARTPQVRDFLDEDFQAVGETICGVYRDGGDSTDALVAFPSAYEEATRESLMGFAVRNYCPEYSPELAAYFGVNHL